MSFPRFILILSFREFHFPAVDAIRYHLKQILTSRILADYAKSNFKKTHRQSFNSYLLPDFSKKSFLQSDLKSLSKFFTQAQNLNL